MTKDSTDAGGKGEEKKVTTEVATAPAVEMDLDDRWADQAFVPATSPRASAPEAKRRAAANEEGVPTVTPGVTVTTLELGYEDTLLRPGDTVTVASTKDEHLLIASEKGLLLDFVGKTWRVQMITGSNTTGDLFTTVSSSPRP